MNSLKNQHCNYYERKWLLKFIKANFQLNPEISKATIVKEDIWKCSKTVPEQKLVRKFPKPTANENGLRIR